jgi:hypothetical protein
MEIGIDSWAGVRPGMTDQETGRSSDAEAAQRAIALRVFLPELLASLASVRIGDRPSTCRTAGQFAAKMGVVPRLDTEWVSELWRSLGAAAHLSQALTLVLKLHHEEKTSPTALSRLPLWHWAKQLAELGASCERAERRGWIEKGVLRPGLLPLARVARRAGLGKAHLRALVHRGEVEPTKVLLTGHKRVLLDAGDIDTLAAHRPVGYQYGRVLPFGVVETRMKYVRNAGLASVRVDRYGRRWLDGVDVRNLLAALAKRAAPLSSARGSVVNLASATIWQQRHVPVLKQLISRVLSGELAVWFSGDAPGLDRYFVGADFLCELAWRTRVAGGHEGVNHSQRVLDLGAGEPTLEYNGKVPARLVPLSRPKQSWLAIDQSQLFEAAG